MKLELLWGKKNNLILHYFFSMALKMGKSYKMQRSPERKLSLNIKYKDEIVNTNFRQPTE